MAVTEQIAERYGRTRKRARRDRWWIIALAVAFVAVFTAWVVWGSGLDQSSSNLEATDTAHTIIDARSVSITFAINTTPNTPVTCAIQALDESFAIVGWRIVSYPGSPERVTSHTETIRTTQLSNTGLISSCWLT